MPKAPKGFKPKQSTIELIEGQDLFDGRSDGKSWSQEKEVAKALSTSVKGPGAGYRVSEDAAAGAAMRLREQRARSLHPKADPGVADLSGKSTAIPKSELKPLASGIEPKLKADEAIRSEASKTLRERRASAARRLAVRGGGEDRRQALVKGLESRRVAKGTAPSVKVQTPKTPGIKLRSGAGIIGAIAGLPSLAAGLIDLQKSAKSKNPPTRSEGVRKILGMEGEETSLVKELRKQKKLKVL